MFPLFFGCINKLEDVLAAAKSNPTTDQAIDQAPLILGYSRQIAISNTTFIISFDAISLEQNLKCFPFNLDQLIGYSICFITLSILFC